MCRENLEAVIRMLQDLNSSAKPIGHHERFEVDKGPAKLSVYITRGMQHADWFCVNDRVGWVDRNPVERITEAIDRKAERLPQYMECAGLDDIRLLIVANQKMNSGKLRLEQCPAFNLRGFQIIYFFYYPENIIVFE